MFTPDVLVFAPEFYNQFGFDLPAEPPAAVDLHVRVVTQ